MIFHDVEQNEAEWHTLRLGIPTSSAFHRIMTPKKRELSTQAAPYMFRLLAEWVTGQPIEMEDYQAPWMQRGQELEDEAVKAYEGLSEVETSRGGFCTTDDGMAGCSPDRLVGADGLLEIKCPLLPGQIENALTDAAEDDHRAQLQGQLWITGRKWVDVFSYHPLLILEPRRVVRDEAFITDLARVAAAFVATMLKLREELLRRFPRILDSKNAELARQAAARIANDDPMGVSDADVEVILEANRRRDAEEQRQ